MSVSDKVRRLDELKTRRQVEKDLRGKKSVPPALLVLGLVFIPASMLTGLYIGKFSPSLNPELQDSIEIDGYTFHFVSEEEDKQMKDAWGYTYMYGPDKIWLNKELLEREMFYQLERTCNHELLHRLGLGEDVHDKIERYEQRIDDPICNKLLERVKA